MTAAMVSLAPLEDEALAAWIAESLSGYVAQRIASGEDAALARSKAQADRNAFFPGGRPAGGQLVFRILEDAAPVGTLWIGPVPDSLPTHWWVWSIEIGEHQRGRGLGRAAMLLAEDEARSHGATQLGLNVFNHNRPAVHLYETLGYEITSQQMRKELQCRADV
ncbi:MAG TPA: GNAT family N-acetyltransferase [Solirubrobacteraceae bacterium]